MRRDLKDLFNLVNADHISKELKQLLLEFLAYLDQLETKIDELRESVHLAHRIMLRGDE